MPSRLPHCGLSAATAAGHPQPVATAHPAHTYTHTPRAVALIPFDHAIAQQEKYCLSQKIQQQIQGHAARAQAYLCRHHEPDPDPRRDTHEAPEPRWASLPCKPIARTSEAPVRPDSARAPATNSAPTDGPASGRHDAPVGTTDAQDRALGSTGGAKHMPRSSCSSRALAPRSTAPSHRPPARLSARPTKKQRLTASTERVAHATSALLSQTAHWQGAAQGAPSQMACDFGLDLAHTLSTDESEWALRPLDPEQLGTACMAMYGNLERAAPQGTLKQDKSHWNWWTRWCKTWNTPPMRTDYKANTGSHWLGSRREAFLQAAALPWILCRMKARGRPFPLPTSALQVILGVRRVHRRLGFELVPFRQVTCVLKAMMREYCALHGPESLLPQRKNPFMHWMVLRLLETCRVGGTKLGSRTVAPESRF
jgi:hypothetical protein